MCWCIALQVFGDRPSPRLSVAADMFAAAVAVVAPHGAGLSNLVFSEPGTAVIEGVCNEPHVNMCYQVCFAGAGRFWR